MHSKMCMKKKHTGWKAQSCAKAVHEAHSCAQGTEVCTHNAPSQLHSCTLPRKPCTVRAQRAHYAHSKELHAPCANPLYLGEMKPPAKQNLNRIIKVTFCEVHTRRKCGVHSRRRWNGGLFVKDWGGEGRRGGGERVQDIKNCPLERQESPFERQESPCEREEKEKGLCRQESPKAEPDVKCR